MNRNGFTLVEIIVAIAIIAVLSTISTFQFSQYLRKNAIERQIRQLYGDMMELRTKAVFEKRSRLIRLTSAGYSIYSSAETASTVNPVESGNFKIPITFNNGGDIIYDTRGLLDEGIGTICVVEANSSPVDSIVLSFARIEIGKRAEGEACASDYIVAR